MRKTVLRGGRGADGPDGAVVDHWLGRNTVRPKLIAILVMVVLVLIVLFQNLEKVAIKFFFWSPEMPLLALVIICLLVGFVLGLLTCALRKE